VFEDGERASVSLHLKFPGDLDLRTAHEIAERVERAIRERPGVEDVQTHLEPLEQPLRSGPADAAAGERALRAAQELVRERTGRSAERVRLLATDAGQVLFLTLAGREGESLPAAHRLASELEDELRARVGGLADVVIHTEP
jgi:divalent metal cation (Fe/Co/Zn/Cd) transporter